MKLRAKIIDQGFINLFSKIFQSVSKLGKLCVVRFTQDNVLIILSDQYITNSCFNVCQISQERFFEEYVMEGLDPNDANEIYMEVLVENIIRALKNPNSTKSLKIKLTKRKGPTLTLEAENITTSTGSRFVTHDIPVNLIAKKFWSEYHEPKMLTYDIILYMPNIKIIRNVLDRMKNMGNHLTLAAKPNGELSLNVDTDVVSITTHFTDLSILKANVQNPDSNFGYDSVTKVRVDLKKLSAFVSSHQQQAGVTGADHLVLSMAHEPLIHISVHYTEDCQFQFTLAGFAENA